MHQVVCFIQGVCCQQMYDLYENNDEPPFSLDKKTREHMMEHMSQTFSCLISVAYLLKFDGIVFLNDSNSDKNVFFILAQMSVLFDENEYTQKLEELLKKDKFFDYFMKVLKTQADGRPVLFERVSNMLSDFLVENRSVLSQHVHKKTVLKNGP